MLFVKLHHVFTNKFPRMVQKLFMHSYDLIYSFSSLNIVTYCERQVQEARDANTQVVDSSQGTAGGQPPVEPAKMKGLLKGLRYISQIFGKHSHELIIRLQCFSSKM